MYACFWKGWTQKNSDGSIRSYISFALSQDLGSRTYAPKAESHEAVDQGHVPHKLDLSVCTISQLLNLYLQQINIVKEGGVVGWPTSFF